jgi:nicotinamidase-related amidase
MELLSFLLEKEATDVFVVGLSGDYCIKSTVIDAARLTLKTASGLEIKLRTCRK